MSTFFPLSIVKYLLSKNIGIMVLNTIDYKENEQFQARMREEVFNRILTQIKCTLDVLSIPEDRIKIHEKLGVISEPISYYLAGISFGGTVAVRFAQSYPRTFNGYVSHDGALARYELAHYIDPLNYVNTLQDNILLFQNYTDSNVRLGDLIVFYKALEQARKAELIKLHFFPEANLTAHKQLNIGHGFSDEEWYLEEYTQTLLNFIERTKEHKTKFISVLPGSVQEFKRFFNEKAFQEHASSSSMMDRWISIGFKIYKNALQVRDPKLRKYDNFEKNAFMKKWFKIYKIKKSNHTYREFLQKALDILSDEKNKEDESFDAVYKNIIIETLNPKLLYAGVKTQTYINEMFVQQFKEFRSLLNQTLVKSRELGRKIVRNKVKEAQLLHRLGQFNTSPPLAEQEAIKKRENLDEAITTVLVTLEKSFLDKNQDLYISALKNMRKIITNKYVYNALFDKTTTLLRSHVMKDRLVTISLLNQLLQVKSNDKILHNTLKLAAKALIDSLMSQLFNKHSFSSLLKQLVMLMDRSSSGQVILQQSCDFLKSKHLSDAVLFIENSKKKENLSADVK